MDVVELLRQLVGIDSINPDFPSASGFSAGGERKVAECVADLLQPAGFKVEILDVLNGRPNLLARRPGKTEKPVVFSAHMDTVPVADMNIEPFDAEVREGCVYGRGSADTKGSIAAMTVALLRLVSGHDGELPELALLLTCDEERNFGGARYFVNNLPTPPLGVVIGEPTGNILVTSHKGVYRTTIRSRGRSAHSSVPQQGANAIYRMTPVLERLQNLAEDLLRRPGDPLLGKATLVVGTIHGGTVVNMVPELCEIAIDRRVLPGETDAEMAAELSATLEGLPHVEILPPSVAVPGFAISPEHEWVAVTGAALGQTGGETIAYATDASIIAAAGVPCVVYGPGEAAAAHTADEHIRISQLQEAVDGYMAVALKAGEKYS